ncbi:MAG: PAS domain S-box protein [Prolixibacteraceae bacterium]|nr:PAS domain S-box protein [Prolixibacteraceae bacterium]
MEKSYRILLVEDEFFDAELNIREIKKVLPDSKFEIVDNRTSYLNQLEIYIPDVIISDFNLPSFDGLSALKIAKEVCPLTPFIMVTGSINEDTAVECMKAGATDYVLKDSLKRLGPSVLSALEQRKIKEERIEAFETIKLNEARYRYMFHNNPQPMLIYDVENLAILEVNEAAVNHYGYSEMEFLGMTIKELRPKEELEKLLESIKTTDLTKSNQTGEWKHIKKNGEIIYVEVVSHSVVHHNRKARHVLIIDITERKNAEEKLARERKLLRTLIDNLPVTIYVKDAECRKIISNRADQEVVGAKSEAEVIGKTDLETFNNEIGQRGYADDLTVINSGQAVINREEDFYDSNGIQRWLITSKIPLSDENGQTLGLVGIGRDITDQKLAQDKILKLSKGIEQSPSSIEITDSNGIIEYINPKFTETTGYTPEEIIGKHARLLKSEKMSPETYADLWETISSGGIWKKELLNRKKDGTTFWELVTLTSIKNEKGIITNYIAIKEDITERKMMEQELIKAKEKAEESDRLKSAFLANMSHEIRTPLNSIIGFSELLNDPDFDDEQKAEFIRTIVDNGNSLLVIISDIMDFSMLEARQITIRPEKISCRKLLSELLNDFGKKAAEKGVELCIDDTKNGGDLWFESDIYRIKQVFSNLIGNAIKFTASGNITISFKANGEMIEFHVRDTGIGIPSEFHEAIFERFRQVDTAKTRKYGGNGLGLAISKNLTELLGGTIWVDSQVNEYSDFGFTVPLKKF